VSPNGDACGSRKQILNALTALLTSPKLGSNVLHRPMWAVWEAAQLWSQIHDASFRWFKR
jgi:hypothetical protein